MSNYDPGALYTTAQASAITGQSMRTIQIHAKRYGIGRLIGGSKGVRVFSPKDIQALLSHKAPEREEETA